MKALISAILVALLLNLPRAVAAAPVSYLFTATIYNVTTNATQIPNLLGTEVSGHLTYNTSLTTPGAIWRSDWRDYTLAGDAAISVEVLGTTYTQILRRAIVIDNFHPFAGYYLDRFMVLSGGPGTDPEWMQLWIDGLDTNTPSDLLSSTNLPTQPIDLSRANLLASPFALETSGLAFSAWVSSLSLDTGQVPEPSTPWLLVLSFIIMLALRSGYHVPATPNHP